MAATATNVLVGAATVKWGAYVSAGGAQTSTTDIGHTKAPVTVGMEKEVVEIMSERSSSPVKILPISIKPTIKVPAMEMTHAFMALAFSQPAANVTGTAPNTTLLVGDMAEQYNYLEIVGPSPGTNSTATWIFYKVMVGPIGEIPIAKGDSQVIEATFQAVRDDTVTAANKFFKVTYS